MDLQNKVVVIVGGSKGFGKALAQELLRKQSTVIILSKTPQSVEQTSVELGVKGYEVDCRNEEQLRTIAETILQDNGKIDIWINAAGVFRTFPKDELLDMERAHELLDINFFGTVLGCRAALPYIEQSHGYIVNVLSSAALDATRAKNAKLYAASKWAVRGYTDALRGENANAGFKILAVYPGGMKTHLHDEALPADFANFMEPKFVAEKVVANFELDTPELDLMIKRPTA